MDILPMTFAFAIFFCLLFMNAWVSILDAEMMVSFAQFDLQYSIALIVHGSRNAVYFKHFVELPGNWWY